MPTPQYIQGAVNPTKAPVQTAQAVAKGDLSALVGNTLVRASDIAWNTDLPTTQTAFANAFLGVSEQTKAAGTARAFGNSSDNVVMVSTDGVYEFDCASANFNVGDFIGPAKDAGNALLPQTVVGVASEAPAFGRVAEAGTAITRVKVRLLSKLMPAARQT